MNQITEVLVQVRMLLADKGKWTQGCAARNGAGGPCASRDHYAQKWCLWGGLWKVTEDYSNFVLADVLEFMTDFTEGFAPELGDNFPKYNDTHTHEEVCKFLNEAIKVSRTL